MPSGQFRMCCRTRSPTQSSPVAKPRTSAQVVAAPKAVSAVLFSQSITVTASPTTASLGEQAVAGHLQFALVQQDDRGPQAGRGVLEQHRAVVDAVRPAGPLATAGDLPGV